MEWDMTLEQFLESNRISEEEWEQSGADWEILKEIAEDHLSRESALSSSAEFVAGRIRTFPGVHSVRWRVKDAEHLLEKIIRKKIKKVQKYTNITKENYFTVITDLVGVRALHLFKDEWLDIDKKIRSTWGLDEDPVFYYRVGDSLSEWTLPEKTIPEKHPSGYRSVHYIINTRPENRDILMEIQVRTIFEEGWSEIDHRVRYPNFSDNENVAVFLTIFNRLAGSADEMGSYVKNLTKALSEVEGEKSKAISERDDALERMSQTIEKLAQLEKKDNESSAIIKTLQTDIADLKKNEQLRVNARQDQLKHAQQIGLIERMNGASAIEEAINRLRENQFIDGSRQIGFGLKGFRKDTIRQPRLELIGPPVTEDDIEQ